MYSVASCYFDPAEVVAFEIDDDAIQVAKQNIEYYELEEKVTIEKCNIIETFKSETEDEKVEDGGEEEKKKDD